VPSCTSPSLSDRPVWSRIRAVVVVLPASMCAMMPMFRVFSSEYCRSSSRPCFLDSVVSARYMRRGGSACGPPLGSALRLPAIVSERLVGLRHLMRVLALLHGGAAVVRGVDHLGG